jgi:peptidoglycan/LPS O-acetylase OafA/YrhL
MPYQNHLNARKKIESFEGLRGIMALLVCVGHLGLNTVAGKIGLELRIELAVDVFFAMSGFVLAQAYYFKRRSFSQLFWGRIARLYPLHALTLLWMFFLSWVIGQSQDWALIWQNVFLLQNVGLPPNRWIFNFPSWSISIEMVVSLLFYFVARQRSSYFCAILVVVGVFLGARELSSGLGPAYNEFAIINSGILRGVAGFCIGCSAFMLVQSAPNMFRKLGVVAPVLFLAIISFFLLPIWTGLIGALAGILFEISLLMFLVISALNDQSSILSYRPLSFLGSISYSIYLLHIPIWTTLASFIPESEIRQTGKVFVLMGIIVASTLCHRYFEMPVQKAILQLTTRKQATRTAMSDIG